MGQIQRMHHGPVNVDIRLVDDVEWVLSMHSAEPPEVVRRLVEQMQRYADQPERVDQVLRDRWYASGMEDVHDFLEPWEVYVVYRLRGWHRLRHGTVTVDARWLCEVRNLLDGLALSWNDCEVYAADLGWDEGGPELLIVKRAVAEGRLCWRCERCRFVVVRDRIDVALDRQGFDGGAYYEHYARPEYDPDEVWRTRVTAPAGALVAGVDTGQGR